MNFIKYTPTIYFFSKYIVTKTNTMFILVNANNI